MASSSVSAPVVVQQVPCFTQRTINKAHEGNIEGLRFSNDGSYCMSCGDDRYCVLWNPYNGRKILTYRGHSAAVCDVSISSDNTMFASCSMDKTIIIWEVKQDAPLRRLRGHNDRINCVCYNENDQVVVSGSYDATVKLWDMRSKSVVPIQTLTGFTDSVTCVRVRDTAVATACVDGYVRTFDVRTGGCVTDCLFRPITNIRLSEEGMLVQTLDSTIRLLDRSTGKLLSKFNKHQNTQYKVGAAFSSSGELVVSGSEDAIIYIYELVTGQVVGKAVGHCGCITCIEYHPVHAAVFVSAATDGCIRCWGPWRKDNEEEGDGEEAM